MRKISTLFFFVTCLLQFSVAQINPNASSYDTTTFQGKIDYTIQNLDKNQVPTQILYDRVFPLARLDVFNQGSPDTSSYNHFLQTVSELYNGSYNTANMLPPDAMQASM